MSKSMYSGPLCGERCMYFRIRPGGGAERLQKSRGVVDARTQEGM